MINLMSLKDPLVFVPEFLFSVMLLLVKDVVNDAIEILTMT
ncbi:MAG: hypothetical protein ACKOYP_09730 [Bacteroidota bacterium]